MDALFTAFDTTTLVTNYTSVLLVGVAILGLAVGWKKLKKGGGSI